MLWRVAASNDHFPLMASKLMALAFFKAPIASGQPIDALAIIRVMVQVTFYRIIRPPCRYLKFSKVIRRLIVLRMGDHCLTGMILRPGHPELFSTTLHQPASQADMIWVQVGDNNTLDTHPIRHFSHESSPSISGFRGIHTSIYQSKPICIA